MKHQPITGFLLVAVATAAMAQAPARVESVDLDIVHRIKAEATTNSKVMNSVFQLTDVIGHRLTNSPGYFAAASWAEKQLKEWGIDAHQEKWGPYGRGWTFTHFSAHMTEPTAATLIGVPLAYTPSTKGKVSGEVLAVNMGTDSDLERYRGRIKGKILLMNPGREIVAPTRPVSARYSDQELQALALPAAGRGAAVPGTAAVAAGRGANAKGGEGRGGNGGNAPGAIAPAQQFTNRLNKFLVDEGVLVAVRIANTPSDAGNVFAQAGGPRDVKDPLPPPTVALLPEHYNRILRLLDEKIPVKLEFEVEAKFFDDRTDSVNVIGEIPGGAKKDEVVMIGAHLDSWHGGTGATDNAAGSAVMLEAMRILKQLKLPMDRTVRVALWGGEEQGLLGSRAYVNEHFSARDMKVTGDHAKLSGYFNVDNGTGKIRGIYLQGNDRMRPIFEQWLKPFADQGAQTISIRNTGGTDHTNFDAVGLPGFQFIQDAMDYNTRTHHSNMDVYDRVQREDLQQIATIVASFVYNAATRPDLLPRKPLPAPTPTPPTAR